MVVLREHRQRIAPHLVGHRAVGGDAVRPDEYGIHLPAANSEPAALSVSKLYGIPLRSASYAVSRAPWSSGRVSSTHSCRRQPSR